MFKHHNIVLAQFPFWLYVYNTVNCLFCNYQVPEHQFCHIYSGLVGLVLCTKLTQPLKSGRNVSVDDRGRTARRLDTDCSWDTRQLDRDDVFSITIDTDSYVSLVTFINSCADTQQIYMYLLGGIFITIQ